MKFSLVLCTLDRTDAVERFVSSLVKQSYQAWNLTVVDQNSDERLAPILDQYGLPDKIQRVRSAKGLSRARNVGLKFASGDVIGFPDDDCWYGPGLLERVRQWLEAHPPTDGLSVTVRDGSGRLTGCHWDKKGGSINRANVWCRALSTAIFLRRKVIEAVGEFDIELGVGSGTRWGSGEETDYLLRAFQYGFRLEYNPSLCVFHERRVLDGNAAARGRSYGLGFGHVQRKHQYPFRIVAYYWLRSAVGALIAIAKLEPAEARLRWGNLKGRVIGWLR